MNRFSLFILIASSLSFISCSPVPFNANLTENAPKDTNSTQNLTNDYTDQALNILKVNCASCHGTTGGSGNVYGLSNINHMVASGLIVPGKPDQSLIYNEITTNAMPPGTPLSNDEKHVIREWLLATNSGPTPTPTPTPTPAPTPAPLPPSAPSPSPAPTNPNATYSYISKNILQTRCTSCHSSFKSYNGTLGYISPGKPSSSPLFVSINSGSMPKGSSKLNSADISAIKDWITQGALNN